MVTNTMKDKTPRNLWSKAELSRDVSICLSRRMVVLQEVLDYAKKINGQRIRGTGSWSLFNLALTNIQGAQ